MIRVAYPAQTSERGSTGAVASHFSPVTSHTASERAFFAGKWPPCAPNTGRCFTNTGRSPTNTDRSFNLRTARKTCPCFRCVSAVRLVPVLSHGGGKRNGPVTGTLLPPHGASRTFTPCSRTHLRRMPWFASAPSSIPHFSFSSSCSSSPPRSRPSCVVCGSGPAAVHFSRFRRARFPPAEGAPREWGIAFAAWGGDWRRPGLHRDIRSPAGRAACSPQNRG